MSFLISTLHMIAIIVTMGRVGLRRGVGRDNQAKGRAETMITYAGQSKWAVWAEDGIELGTSPAREVAASRAMIAPVDGIHVMEANTNLLRWIAEALAEIQSELI